MAAARRAEKQLLRSSRAQLAKFPLFGIPISIKDNIWTRGIRSTAGSKILGEFVPAENSTVARKLDRAGAILLGKTNMNEFAYGITGGNAHYGPAHNPWGLDRIPGGSSSGSGVAVAAGLCAASVGTDTGGSIRVPSALCGTVGLKPTFGRVSSFGTMPLSPSLDHVGPIAHSVADAAILLGLIAGRDPLDPTSSPKPVDDYRGALQKKSPRKIRLGRPREHYWERLDPEVRRAADAAVRSMEKRGAVVREVSLPSLKESLDAATDVSLAEALHVHEAAGYFPARAADYGEEVRQRIEAGRSVSAVRFLEGLDVRKRLLAEFDAAFQEVDAIVAPSLPVPAPLIGAESVQIDGEEVGTRPAIVGHSRPANFTGLPAISVPCGFTRAGLPVGLQFIGRAFDEATILRIAFSYERENDWRARHPRIE
jgi:aspartyl-tRNA(Asn)/glutamyl-tRNA(Gln) amidotransferase subunit A